MSAPVLDPPLAVAYRAFLDDVQETLQRIRLENSASQLALAGGGRPLDASAVHEILSERLRAAMHSAQLAGADIAAPSFKQSQYLMALTADGQLSVQEWQGRTAWKKKGLVKDFAVPDGIDPEPLRQADALLAQEIPDTSLAQVLLLTLAAGYPEAPSTHQRNDARARLFRLLSDRMPDLADEPEELFEDAYRHRFQRGPTGTLPSPRRWLVASAIAAALLLIGSYVIWNQTTSDLEGHVDEILLQLSPAQDDFCEQLADVGNRWTVLVDDSGTLNAAQINQRLDVLLPTTQQLAQQLQELAEVRSSRRLGDTAEAQDIQALNAYLADLATKPTNDDAARSLVRTTRDLYDRIRNNYCVPD